MSYTTLTVRHDIAKKLRLEKATGESYSDLLDRLLESQPAKCVEEWIESLKPLEGHGVFTPEQRARLKNDQLKPRDSRARRKKHVVI